MTCPPSSSSQTSQSSSTSTSTTTTIIKRKVVHFRPTRHVRDIPHVYDLGATTTDMWYTTEEMQLFRVNGQRPAATENVCRRNITDAIMAVLVGQDVLRNQVAVPHRMATTQEDHHHHHHHLANVYARYCRKSQAAAYWTGVRHAHQVKMDQKKTTRSHSESNDNYSSRRRTRTLGAASDYSDGSCIVSSSSLSSSQREEYRRQRERFLQAKQVGVHNNGNSRPLSPTPSRRMTPLATARQLLVEQNSILLLDCARRSAGTLGRTTKKSVAIDDSGLFAMND